MKLLVPTDFSETSEYALNASLLFAQKLDAEIHLLHCIELPKVSDLNPSHNAIMKNLDKLLYKEAEKKLNSFKHMLVDHNIPCEFTILRNSYLDTVFDQELFADTDLVLIGSHGTKGINEWFIGSNTQKVIRKINKKILIVKNELEDIDFKKVAYVTGLADNEKSDFKEFLNMMSQFKIEELHILSIDTFLYFTEPTIVVQSALNDYKQLAERYNVKTHFVRDYSVVAGVRHFVERNGIDLVAMSNSHRHPIKRIIRGSNVEIIVNQSEVPVLTIDS